jgi:hypothetical protein
LVAMTASASLIPLHIARTIASANGWDDGDTWVIGNGRVVEYDQGRHAFIIHNRKHKTVLGCVNFSDVMERGREGGSSSTL